MKNTKTKRKTSNVTGAATRRSIDAVVLQNTAKKIYALGREGCNRQLRRQKSVQRLCVWEELQPHIRAGMTAIARWHLQNESSSPTAGGASGGAQPKGPNEK